MTRINFDRRPRRDLRVTALRGLLICIAIGLAAWLGFMAAGCGYAKHNDPDVRIETSAAAAQEAARLHAKDAGGQVEVVVNPEGSMMPLIHQGDYLVVVPTSFSKDLLGKVCTYHPAWNHEQNTTHRMVAWDSGGFIASGDHNPTSEPQERVTAANYVGEVVAIYKPPFYGPTETP